MKRIVALDPGGTTGWAMWQSIPLKSGNKPPWLHFTCGQLGPEEHHEDLYALLEMMHAGAYSVVCESFEFRQRPEDASRANINLMSKEYIGVTKLFCKKRNVPLSMYTAGSGKGFIPDKPKDGLEANAKLKVLGLYVPGNKHAMDAMRHLVHHLVVKERMNDLIKPWRDL